MRTATHLPETENGAAVRLKATRATHQLKSAVTSRRQKCLLILNYFSSAFVSEYKSSNCL